MCGEIYEHDHIDKELFDRFVELAGRHGVSPGSPDGDMPSTLLTGQAQRSAYMDGLFKAGLARAVSNGANLPPGDRMDSLAGQAIVFARLAGFLAGQFPPEADLFHSTIGALMEGHDEQARAI